MSPDGLLWLYCVAIVVISVLGGLVPLTLALTHTRLQMYLSFGSGVMLGAAMLHMLPESIHLLGDADFVCILVLCGLLFLFLTERFFTSHQHEHPHMESHAHDHDHPATTSTQARARLNWPAVVVGLSIHTLAAGVALASAMAASSPESGSYHILGFGVFLAIVLHKPADSLTIVSVVLAGGHSKLRAHLVNFLFALVIPIGVILFHVARSMASEAAEGSVTGGALAFSTGMFLCIALSDLLPELHFHGHDRGKLTALLIAGVALMLIAGRFEGHSHGHSHSIEHGHDEHGHDEHGHDEHGHDEHGHDEHGHDEHGHDEHGHDEQGHKAIPKSEHDHDEDAHKSGKASDHKHEDHDQAKE